MSCGALRTERANWAVDTFHCARAGLILACRACAANVVAWASGESTWLTKYRSGSASCTCGACWTSCAVALRSCANGTPKRSCCTKERATRTCTAKAPNRAGDACCLSYVRLIAASRTVVALLLACCDGKRTSCASAWSNCTSCTRIASGTGLAIALSSCARTIAVRACFTRDWCARSRSAVASKWTLKAGCPAARCSVSPFRARRAAV